MLFFNINLVLATQDEAVKGSKQATGGDHVLASCFRESGLRLSLESKV